MTSQELTIFRDYRVRGYRFVDAIRNAKVEAAFRMAENEGKVRICRTPDIEYHDTWYVETWGLTERQVSYTKASIERMIEEQGLWTYDVQRRCPCCAEWTTVDSVGDVIGELDASGYHIDLMRTVLDATGE